MRKLAAVLAIACGAPSVTGTWSGTLSTIDACTDGSGGTTDSQVRWALIEKPANLSITPENGTCGSFTATPSGGGAWTIDSATCGIIGPIRRNTVTGGELQLTQTGQLSVLFQTQLDFVDGGQCLSDATGHLLREVN